MAEFADKVCENVTSLSGAITVGTSIPLAGVISADYFTFASQWAVNDPFHCTLKDAAGAVWLDIDGKLTDSTHIQIVAIEGGSSGRGAGVTLTSGTHRIGNTLGADAMNKRIVFADAFIDFVASGLVWSAATLLNGNMTAGVACVTGQRVRKGSVTNHGFTASRDTYVDLKYDGTLTYVEVTNGAAAGALTANSIRIAKVVTNGSAITSITQNGTKDSLGNCLYNSCAQPRLQMHNVSAFTATGSGGETAGSWTDAETDFDNDSMHEGSVHPTRVTFQRAGFYRCMITGLLLPAPASGTFALRPYKNGTATYQDTYIAVPSASTTGWNGLWADKCVAGDYLEVKMLNTTGSSVSAAMTLNVSREG